MIRFFVRAAAGRSLAPAIAAALVAMLPAAASADSLAVLELRSRLPESEKGAVDAAYLTDRARAAALRAAPELRVMTRENVVVLLKAMGKSLEECEGECEVDTGRRLGADLVLSGELLRFGKSLKASLRLHDTRDGRLVAASVATGAGAEELDAALPAAVQELLAARGEPVSSRRAEAARPALIAAPPAGETAAQRIGSALALEARLIVPLSANFGPDSGGVSEGGFFPGLAGGGVRAGGVTWIDSSLGVRWGAGLDLRAGRFSESVWNGTNPVATTATQLMLCVPLHLGLLFPAGSWVLGASWTPGFFRRPSNDGTLGAVVSVRPLGLELHADRALGEATGGKAARLRLFAEVSPQVGYKDVGDQYTAYASAGAGVAWY